MENKKLTKIEKYWILYDVGNSAFVMLVATLIPIYFNYLAESEGVSKVDYLAYWGYAASVATVIVALIGPVLGTIADTKGFKKPLFLATVLLGVAGCSVLSFPTNWLLFLAVFVLAKVGYNASLIFYDSMLVDVTEPEKMDAVSSHGYAWGYIGSCIPFVASLILVLMHEKIGISMGMAMTLAFLLNAVWWLLATVPLLRNYEQSHYIDMPKHPVKDSFSRLFATLKDIKSQKQQDSRYLHRGDMDWKKAENRKEAGTVQEKIYSMIQKMIQIRGQYPVFETGAKVWTVDTWDDHVLGIGRYLDGEKLIALFNFSEEPKMAWINEQDGEYVDLFTGEKMEAAGIQMAPYGYHWLYKKF